MQIPPHAKLMLATSTILSAPSFIGLLTKTKIWCAITGRCEIGGANVSDLALGAIFNGLFLIALYYVVLRRRWIFALLFGAALLLAFSMMSVSFVLAPRDGNGAVSVLDALLLSSMLFIGISLCVFAIQLLKTNAALGDAQPDRSG